MSEFVRRKPDPVPPIHPLPEYLVEGERAAWYAEMKQSLQVPWMGVVTMAFAHYPTFFAELWRGSKPLCESRAFIKEAMALRDLVETRVAELQPPPLVERLREAGYAPREIDAILAVIQVFSHGNHLYALIATIARFLMEEGAMSGADDAPPFHGRHAPTVSVPFLLMEEHHADPPTRSVFADIKRTLGLPFVNTDYRALARWPSYFALAWGDLRGVAGTEGHEAICRAYHERLAAAVREGLPNPGGLSSPALREAARADAPLDEIAGVCRLFQWLLPGLATNVAFFRHQVEGP